MFFLLVFIVVNSSLVWAICVSKGFRPMREYFTRNYIARLNKKSIYRYFYGFIDKVLDCYYCTGAWVSPISYLITYHIIDYNLIDHIFIGAITSVFIVTGYMKLEKK